MNLKAFWVMLRVSIRKNTFPTFYLDVNVCIHVKMNGISWITVVLERLVE